MYIYKISLTSHQRNADQNYIEISPYPNQNGNDQKRNLTTNTGGDKLKPFYANQLSMRVTM